MSTICKRNTYDIARICSVSLMVGLNERFTFPACLTGGECKITKGIMDLDNLYIRRQDESYAKWIDEKFSFGPKPLFCTFTCRAERDEVGDLNRSGELIIDRREEYKPPDDIVIKKINRVVRSLSEDNLQSIFFLEKTKKGYPHVHGIIESKGNEHWFFPPLIKAAPGRTAEPWKARPRVDGGSIYNYCMQEWKRGENLNPERSPVTSGYLHMNNSDLVKMHDYIDASLVFPMEQRVDIGWVQIEEVYRIYLAGRYAAKEGHFIGGWFRRSRWD